MFMLLAVLGTVLTTGCKSLFPTTSNTVNSRWKTYDEVFNTFNKIEPYNTDASGLKTL